MFEMGIEEAKAFLKIVGVLGVALIVLAIDAWREKRVDQRRV